MRLRRVMVHRFRSLFRRARTEEQMRQELELHLEQLTREYMAAGMGRADAAAAARREFGTIESVKEECRDMRRVNWIEDLGKDLVYACRILAKSPGFTLTAIVSLALGIGANTAIFSVVNTFLLRPLPFPHPERLVGLFERGVLRGEDSTGSLVAPANFLYWQKTASGFEHISAFTMRTATLTTGSPGVAPQRVMICLCSGNVFETLGVVPALGRRFRPEEDRTGAPNVVIIADSMGQRLFGGSAQAIGKDIRLNGSQYRVIGVMPRGFIYPHREVEIWKPLLADLAPQQQIRHDLHYLQVIARLRGGTTREQARVELDGIAARYKNTHPDEATGTGANVVPLHSLFVQNVRKPLIVLLGAVCCVLLIACVNIANLVLTRATARIREIGIRTALGAARGRIIRQLVTESLVVALLGGIVGVMLAVSIAGVLTAHAPGASLFLPAGKVPLDAAMFLFAFGLAAVTGVAVGLFPAIRVSRADVVERLKESGRSSTGTRNQGHFRNSLVAVEVSLSVVLLIAAGLLLHSFFLLYQVQPGARLDHTLTMNVSMPASYKKAEQQSALLSALGERLRNVPGVRSAGLTTCPPLAGTCNVIFFYVDGRPFVLGKYLSALERSVDPDYFQAAGIPLLRGRTFRQQDGTGFDAKFPRLGSVVISESMANAFFPNEDPIGKRIFFDYEVQQSKNEGTPVPRYEVVGVVGDVLPTLDRKPSPTFYRPLLDNTSNAATVLLHTAVEPQSVVSAARREIRKLDPGLVIYQVQTMDERIGKSTSDRQFSMLLFAAFAALALLLASVGLYGLVSYAISQRKSEIGIRMALGATGSDVGRMVVAEGMKPAAAGLLLGIVAAVFACRILKSQLFGITPGDPLTFGIVPLVLLLIALLACYLPAMRAARLDPTVALRAE